MMVRNGAYFDDLPGTGLKWALSRIPGSVTTDYILFSLGINGTTDIVCLTDYGEGDTTVLAADGQVTEATDKLLCSIVRAGVAKGKCQRVWLTIGSGKTSTFEYLQDILNTDSTSKSTLLANFRAIVQAIKGIKGVESVGFDLDYEESGDELAARVASVTIALYNQFKCPITFCPSQGWLQYEWIRALQQVYSTLKTQPVVGYNLQTYRGSGENRPNLWTTALAPFRESAGIDDSFVVCPVVSCGPSTTAHKVVQMLRGWGSKGASLWPADRLEWPFEHTLGYYSKAIAEGTV